MSSRADDYGHGLKWTPRSKAPGAVFPLPAPKVAPAVFHGASAWVANMDGFAIEYLPLLAGFRSLVMQTYDGTIPVPVRTDRLAQFRNAGITCLSWSWCAGTDARAEGWFAAERCHAFGFAAHWANAEKAYDSNGGRLANSHEWLDGWFSYWRSINVPAVPLGVSPEPRSGMDHGAWQSAGATIGPQAYAENGASVDDVVAWQIKCGWQVGQIVPLVAPVGGRAKVPAATYVAQAKAHGLPGLVLYPADQLLNRPGIYKTIAQVTQ